VYGDGFPASGANKLRDHLYDQINKLDSPDCFIEIAVRVVGRNALSGRRVRAFLRERLESVDADSLASLVRENNGYLKLPKWDYNDEGGWRINFRPIPKSPDLRGKPGVRPLGAIEAGSGWVNAVIPLRSKITKKATRYGTLDLPFVVAVNAMDISTETEDEAAALFGTELYVLNPVADAHRFEMRRARDGVWTEGGGPRNTGVSAVLMCRSVTPWTARRASLTLYLNPWATRTVSGSICGFHSARLSNGTLKFESGTDPSTVLGLPQGWPLT
jgi:hypothetical protein